MCRGAGAGQTAFWWQPPLPHCPRTSHIPDRSISRTIPRVCVIRMTEVFFIDYELAQQTQNLVLDGDVQRCARLVSNKQLGAGRQRHADAHTLPHTPAELDRDNCAATVLDRPTPLLARKRPLAGESPGVTTFVASSSGNSRMTASICSPTLKTGFRQRSDPERSSRCPAREPVAIHWRSS